MTTFYTTVKFYGDDVWTTDTSHLIVNASSHLHVIDIVQGQYNFTVEDRELSLGRNDLGELYYSIKENKGVTDEYGEPRTRRTGYLGIVAIHVPHVGDVQLVDETSDRG